MIENIISTFIAVISAMILFHVGNSYYNRRKTGKEVEILMELWDDNKTTDEEFRNDIKRNRQ